MSLAKSHNMASKSLIEVLKKDDVVFSEGDAADKFYFVYSGSIRVEKSKEIGENETTTVRVGYLYPGDYFGELALINDNPRLASCVRCGAQSEASARRALPAKRALLRNAPPPPPLSL